ncbi:hypothetical protein D3C73_503030 [compost metagenome]
MADQIQQPETGVFPGQRRIAPALFDVMRDRAPAPQHRLQNGLRHRLANPVIERRFQYFPLTQARLQKAVNLCVGFP